MSWFLLLSIYYAISIPPSLSSPESTSNPRAESYESCEASYTKTFDSKLIQSTYKVKNT